jgi:competence protein ComEC
VVAPLVPVFVAIAAGILVDRYVEPCGTRTWATVALACGGIAGLAIRTSALGSLVLLFALFAVGGGWHHYRWSDLAPHDLARSVSETPQPAWVRGVVREALGLRRSEGLGFRTGEELRVTTRFVLDLRAISDGKTWHPASGRAIVLVTGDRSEIRSGQAVEAAGQIARLAAPSNPGEFDYRAFQRAQGVRLRLTVDDAESFWPDPEGRSSFFGILMGSIQAWSRARLVEQLDPSIAPLAAALLLGQREGIEPEVNDAFARTGTTHLLAISGLQLQALAFVLLVLFRLAGLRRRPAYLAVGLAMIGYALVVGPAPSVVRATVMTSAFCLAAIAERRDRPANTLALAGLGTLAVNPAYLFDVGAQLSFLAIGTLIWLVPPACALVRRFHDSIRCRLFGPHTPLDDLERRLEPAWRTAARRAGARVVDGVVASTVIWLAAVPLVALRFHLVSPIGILLNVPLIPLTSAALLLSGLGLALAPVWAPLAGPPAWIAAVLLKVSRAIVLWGVAQKWGYRFVVGPAGAWVLVFYALLVAAIVGSQRAVRTAQPLPAQWHAGGRRWWFLVGAWVFPGWLFAAAPPANHASLEVEFLAVGHGLAVIIQTPDGQTLLYDCGRLGDPSVGRRIIAPALWARGVSRIDTVLLSHADSDHYGGLTDLLDRFPIGTVRAPPGFAGAANSGAIELIDQVRSRGISVRPIAAPEAWETGGVRFTVRHPSALWHPETSDNARSLVLDVASAGRHLLLTGDLEQLGLDELVARPRPEPPPDVMLAPHHGGRSANPDWLYKWARPRRVIVSQRSPPPRTKDVLAALEERGIALFRTWRVGAIRMRWTSDGIDIRGFLAQNDSDLGNGESAPRQGGAPHRTASEVPIIPQQTAWSSNGAVKFLAGLAGFIVGAIACLVLAVVELGAWALVMPRRSVAGAGDPTLGEAVCAPGLVMEPIVVRARDGVQLAARWFPAPGPGTTARTALLLHGFAEGSSAFAARRVEVLNRHGWNVASLELRGYGRSDGLYATFGGREADDIAVWLDALAERFARLESSLALEPVLWGRSMGAAIAVRAAARDRRTAALVLESPLVDLAASMAIVLRKRRLPFPRLLARLVLRRAGKIAGLSIHEPAPVETAPRVSCSSLIVHGSLDPLVPVAEVQRLAGAFPEPSCRIDVAGAKHNDVVDVGGDELLRRIAAFLDEAVDRRKPAR